MKTKICIFLCLFLNTFLAKAQDIRSTNLTVIERTPTNISVRVTIRTSTSSITKMRVYYELHTNNEIDNPIAQVAKVETFNFFQRLVRSKTVTINFPTSSLRQGFTLTDATKLVVIVDPKTELTETNENNNTSTILLPNQ